MTWTPGAPDPTASAHDADAVVEVFESITAAAESDDASGVYAAVHAALARVQSWLTEPAGVLLVVTRGAVALPGEDVGDLAGSAVWGLVRAAQTEHPGRLVLVDTDTDTAIDPAAVLAVGEPQVVVRDGIMHITRVQPSRAVDTVLTPPPGDGPWRLAVATGGTFDDLALQEIPDADEPLGPGRIRVAVRAIAANFRDVMITLGLYPGDAVMGIEAAGVVTDVGPGVTTVSVGDRVMGLFPEGTGTVATTDARVVLPVPGGLGLPAGRRFHGGLRDRVLRAARARRRATRPVGADPRGHRRRRDGCGAVGQVLGSRGVRDGEPGQVGHVAGHGVRRRSHRRFAQPGLRAEVPGRHRRPGVRRGAGLAGR